MHADVAAIRRVLDEHKQVTLVAHSLRRHPGHRSGRRLAARAQRAFEVGTGHSPFLAGPGQLARIITEVAAPATAVV